jgi:hypothetical protein
MNKNILQTMGFALTISIFILTISCAKKVPESIKIKIDNVKISGMLEGYFKVLPGEYTIEKAVPEEGRKESKVFLSIKIETIKPFEGWGPNTGIAFGGFNPNLLDEQGGTLNPLNTIDYAKLNSILTGKLGDQAMIKLQVGGTNYDFVSDDVWEQIKTKAKGIEILDTKLVNIESSTKNTDNSNKSKNDNSNLSDNSKGNVSNSNENMDAVLNSYENFINNYADYIVKIAAIQKKQKNGDNTSTAELAEIMPKAMELNLQAQELGTKLQKAQGNLTSEQLAKYMKLQLKLVQAAAKISIN